MRGTYVARCEGDAGRTDPLKRQKQFDFLRENPGYAVCFRPVRAYREDDTVFPTPEMRFFKSPLSCRIFRSTILFRRIRPFGGSASVRFSRLCPPISSCRETGKIRPTGGVTAVYGRRGRPRLRQFRRCGGPCLKFSKCSPEYFGTDEREEFLSIPARLLLICKKGEDISAGKRPASFGRENVWAGIMKLAMPKSMKAVLKKEIRLCRNILKRHETM